MGGVPFALCGPFEIVAAAARSGSQAAKPPARLGVVSAQGRGATTPPPRFVPGGGGGPLGRNTATILQGRFSAQGTLAGKIARQTRQKKGKAATRPQGLALPFFWAAQAAQTLAPQGLAGASARPRRPGGRTAARAGAGRRRRTRPRPCAVGLPGVWMAARHRCRARHRIVTGGCLARYLRPLGPHRAGWGLGPGAEGWGPQIGHASGFRINEKSGTPWGSALFQKGGRFRAVLRTVLTLPRLSQSVKRRFLSSCTLPP
jgi:hypothetical protein